MQRATIRLAPSGKTRAEAAAFESPPPNSVEPLPNFCLLVLEPVKLDHLELRGKTQNRWIYCRNDQAWFTQEINPKCQHHLGTAESPYP